MKLNLVSNGIFPIIRGLDGKRIVDLPDTGYDVAGTIQGEGKWMGVPCLFVRTSGCNLRCAWLGANGLGSPCDTPYSSHRPEKNQMETSDICKVLEENADGKICHVVISGGEPLIQADAVAELAKKLRWLDFKVTIETNGTIFDAEVAKHIDLISLSPKLYSSTPVAANLVETGIEHNQKWEDRHNRDRINIDALKQWINFMYENGREFQLKFVVSTPEDMEEINIIVATLKRLTRRVQNTDILLMPEGITPEDLMLKTAWVTKLCLEHGYRFAPRLHTLLWGTKRGV